MKNLRVQQDAVFNKLESLEKRSNVSVVPAAQDFEEDSRMILTMVYFLPDEIKRRIANSIIEPLQKRDPRQYYYSKESLHITIQNIRIMADPPKFTERDIRAVAGLSDYIEDHKGLSFELDGLLKMSASLGVKCYPNQNVQNFVSSLRKKLVDIGVPDDKQYVNNTVIGNVTLCRFYQPPNTEFMRFIKKNRTINFGRVDVDKISLISSNVVCCKEKTKIMKEFKVC